MADGSAIEWTHSTWNPVTGCTKVSAGCDNCYAERFSERFRGVAGHPFESGFDLTLRPERIDQPKRWRRPRMIFVNSMSDLFHKEIPDAFVSRVFDTMETAHWHVYQILTKRSSLMREFVNRRYRDRPAPPHIWLGVSIESSSVMSRLRHLKQNQGGRALRLIRAAARTCGDTEPQWDSLGHSRWRERPARAPGRHLVAPRAPRSVRDPERRVFLQAMGR